MRKDGKTRILLGKSGLDGNDNGVVIVARLLSDRGFGVVYAGLYSFPENLVKIAIQGENKWRIGAEGW